MKQTMLEKIQEIFRDVFDDDELIIMNDTNSETIEDWDSLTHIRLVVLIEKVFGIRFSAGELNKLKNVGEMIDIIKEKHSR